MNSAPAPVAGRERLVSGMASDTPGSWAQKVRLFGAPRRTTVYVADKQRYDSMQFSRSGRSGIQLPAVSLGLWHNFGGSDQFENSRAMLRRAFDLGITHFDLANNYGPPYGSAEETFGQILKKDFLPYRDELIISTKAGWDMWPGLMEIWARANICSPASTRACNAWV